MSTLPHRSVTESSSIAKRLNVQSSSPGLPGTLLECEAETGAYNDKLNDNKFDKSDSESDDHEIGLAIQKYDTCLEVQEQCQFEDFEEALENLICNKLEEAKQTREEKIKDMIRREEEEENDLVQDLQVQLQLESIAENNNSNNGTDVEDSDAIGNMILMSMPNRKSMNFSNINKSMSFSRSVSNFARKKDARRQSCINRKIILGENTNMNQNTAIAVSKSLSFKTAMSSETNSATVENLSQQINDTMSNNFKSKKNLFDYLISIDHSSMSYAIGDLDSESKLVINDPKNNNYQRLEYTITKQNYQNQNEDCDLNQSLTLTKVTLSESNFLQVEALSDPNQIKVLEDLIVAIVSDQNILTEEIIRVLSDESDLKKVDVIKDIIDLSRLIYEVFLFYGGIETMLLRFLKVTKFDPDICLKRIAGTIVWLQGLDTVTQAAAAKSSVNDDSTLSNQNQFNQQNLTVQDILNFTMKWSGIIEFNFDTKPIPSIETILLTGAKIQEQSDQYCQQPSILTKLCYLLLHNFTVLDEWMSKGKFPCFGSHCPTLNTNSMVIDQDLKTEYFVQQKCSKSKVNKRFTGVPIEYWNASEFDVKQLLNDYSDMEVCIGYLIYKFRKQLQICRTGYSMWKELKSSEKIQSGNLNSESDSPSKSDSKDLFSLLLSHPFHIPTPSSSLVFANCKDLSFFFVLAQLSSFSKLTSIFGKYAETHFPASIKKALIFNAPRCVDTAYSTVSGSLSKTTRENIAVVKEGLEEILKESKTTETETEISVGLRRVVSVEEIEDIWKEGVRRRKLI